MVNNQDLKRLNCTSIEDYFRLIIKEDEEGNTEIAKELLDDLDARQTPISQRSMFRMHLKINKINLAMFN
jgi:hypothetical protein